MSYQTLHMPYAYREGHPNHDPKVNAELEEHEKQFGGYNDTPPGWREISEEKFTRGHFFSYSPGKVEHRQLTNAGIKCEKGHPLINARLYFFHDGTGVAMMHDYWAGKVRYFAFGCDHKYREVHGDEAAKLGLRPTGRCDHALHCDKCGHGMVVDSSD